MIKFLSIILFTVFIISCGNQKPNKLPEGVVDKSCLLYTSDAADEP